MPTLGWIEEKIGSNLEVPSSRQSMRKNKLPGAQSPTRSPREPAKGRGFAQSGRSANRHSARAGPALLTRPGPSERKLTLRDPDAEIPPHPRPESLRETKRKSPRSYRSLARSARGVMPADSDDGVPSVPTTSDGERPPRG